MLQGKTVVLVVTGSIAAYKIASLASRLVKLHADVHVIMTPNATHFITPITFETLTGNKCLVDTFDRNFQFHVAHVSLAQQADVLLIAPASADVIGKIANGIADDMLTTTVMACTAPVLISPAMNTHMYENPIVQDNLQKLRSFGYTVIEPAVGMLACRDVGAGKMPEPEVLLQHLLREIACEKDLAGRKILVTAGPTQEALDPVRYLTNHSTGKMGYAVAYRAMLRGAEPDGNRTAAVCQGRSGGNGGGHVSDSHCPCTPAGCRYHGSGGGGLPPHGSGIRKEKETGWRCLHSADQNQGYSGASWCTQAGAPVPLRIFYGDGAHAGELSGKAGAETSGYDRRQQSEGSGCRIRHGHQCGDLHRAGRGTGAAAALQGRCGRCDFKPHGSVLPSHKIKCESLFRIFLCADFRA